jgi:uncharacterized protein YecT (DUF1311 family)
MDIKHFLQRSLTDHNNDNNNDNERMKFSITTSVLSLLGICAAQAMDASPHPHCETQPDGQRVMLRPHGALFNCFETDMNGTFKRATSSFHSHDRHSHTCGNFVLIQTSPW